MQRALGSVFDNVGGHVNGDITSCEKQHQHMSAVTVNGWKMCQVTVMQWNEIEVTTYDTQIGKTKTQTKGAQWDNTIFHGRDTGLAK